MTTVKRCAVRRRKKNQEKKTPGEVQNPNNTCAKIKCKVGWALIDAKKTDACTGNDEECRKECCSPSTNEQKKKCGGFCKGEWKLNDEQKNAECTQDEETCRKTCCIKSTDTALKDQLKTCAQFQCTGGWKDIDDKKTKVCTKSCDACRETCCSPATNEQKKKCTEVCTGGWKLIKEQKNAECTQDEETCRKTCCIKSTETALKDQLKSSTEAPTKKAPVKTPEQIEAEEKALAEQKAEEAAQKILPCSEFAGCPSRTVKFPNRTCPRTFVKTKPASGEEPIETKQTDIYDSPECKKTCCAEEELGDKYVRNVTERVDEDGKPIREYNKWDNYKCVSRPRILHRTPPETSVFFREKVGNFFL